MLSRDGAVAWFSRSDGLERRVMSVSVGEPVSGAGRPLALDATGRSGLVEQEGVAVLLDAGSTGAPRPVVGEPPTGGRDEAAVQAPYTLADVAGGRSVVAAARGGGMWIGRPGGPALAVLASGPGPVHALAVDPTDTLLAAVVGASLQVWPTQLTRAASRIVLTYDNDRDASSDLLGTGRDAAALAALVASTVLRPPLSIGLFVGGARASRSSCARSGSASTNSPARTGPMVSLAGSRWSRSTRGSTRRSICGPASSTRSSVRSTHPRRCGRRIPGRAARAAAEAANRVVAEKAGQLAEAERTLRTVSHPLRRGALIGGGLTLVVGTVAFGVALAADRWATVVAVVSLVSTVLAAVVGAVAEVRRTVAPISELVAAGREVRGRLSWLHRLVGARHRAAATLQVKRTELRIAREDAARLTELAESPQLGAVLQRMSTVTEYRDQLGLVTRTRERFAEIDRAVSLARSGRTAEGDTRPEFERVVILIDDLDRCPPERVVSVLEAVHLLFDFEMFVVLIAVDTRWLEQSLRIRYRRLLGAQDGAGPADYLEKIIQIPLHLQPLDEELVRVMMAGLTGAPVPNEGVRADPPPASPPDPSHANERAERARRAATAPRPARPPLPVASLAISLAEATAMAAVAPLVGMTPRTVKRFVNIYRLLKTRAADAAGFDTPRDGSATMRWWRSSWPWSPGIRRLPGVCSAPSPPATPWRGWRTSSPPPPARTPRLATRCAAGSTTTRAIARPRPPGSHRGRPRSDAAPSAPFRRVDRRCPGGCGREAVQEKLQEMHHTEAEDRAKKADALSAAIDPFTREIDLDCTVIPASTSRFRWEQLLQRALPIGVDQPRIGSPCNHRARERVELTTDVVVLQDPEYDAVASGQAGGSVDVPDLMEESNLRRGG